MDVDNLALLGPGIDFNEIPAIHQKRTLAFVNHFIINTVSIMNKLSRSCEMKLQKFETQLQRMDASLRILEAKLASIPGLEGDEVPPQAAVPPPVPTNESSAAPHVITQTQPTPQLPVVEPETTAPISSGASQDPRYARFFRMVQVGVPPQAVKLKMKAEGLDPSILDNPNAAPPPAPPQPNDDSDSQDSNDSNTSD